MPINTFQKILQSEIRIPKLRSFKGIFQWLHDGLAIALPNALTHSGWRAKALRVSADRSGESFYTTIEQSRFGIRRMTKTSADDESLPVEATVPNDLIFLSKVKLPLAAAKSLANTIGLRLGEISPIPIEDAAFAVDEHTRTINDRIEVDVAIVRKETLHDLRKSAWGKRIESIGAYPNDTGGYKFLFEALEKSTLMNRKMAIDAALIGAAILMLFASIDGNIKIRHLNLEQYEASILSELRATRENTALFDGIEPTTLEQYRGEYSKSVSHELQAVLAKLPAGVLIGQLSFQPDFLILSGFIPSDTDKILTFKQFTTEPFGRPGYDKLRLQIEQGNLP